MVTEIPHHCNCHPRNPPRGLQPRNSTSEHGQSRASTLREQASRALALAFEAQGAALWVVQWLVRATAEERQQLGCERTRITMRHTVTVMETKAPVTVLKVCESECERDSWEEEG